MKKILTYGTFDLLHSGHIKLLRRARELGDYLVVGISSDEFNKCKGKESVYSFEDRKLILESLRFVDEVIPENNWDQKTLDVDSHDIDIFVMGDDWKGKFDFLDSQCKVVYLERTPDISTTQVKETLSQK